MYYRLPLKNLGNRSIAQVFAAIPAYATSLDLSENELHLKSGDELAVAFAAIPAQVASLDLSKNGLHHKSGAELAVALAAIPAGVNWLNLSANELHHKSGAELAVAFAAIPAGMIWLKLGANELHHKSGAELAVAFAAIPAQVASLDLSANELHHKSGDELAKAFAAIPTSVVVIDLRGNGFDHQSGAKLAQVFAAIAPRSLMLESNTQDHYHCYCRLHYLLDGYLKDRTAVMDSSGGTKEYFHGSFFSIFQKSFTQKRNAVNALKSALNGESVDLSEHLSTLRNGKLGQQLRQFIKSGEANILVGGKPVNTVSDFVKALQKQCANQSQPNHII